jgi:hypothetical protein
MATKTEEIINVIQREITRLQTQIQGLQDEVTRANLIESRSTLAVLEAAVTELRKWRDEADRRAERLAVVESQLAELKTRFEEKDRRWWQFWVGVSAVGLTFVANLVIQLILLYSRKSG